MEKPSIGELGMKPGVEVSEVVEDLVVMAVELIFSQEESVSRFRDDAWVLRASSLLSDRITKSAEDGLTEGGGASLFLGFFDNFDVLRL